MARDLSDARPSDQPGVPSFVDGLFTTEFWTTVGGLLANLLVVLVAIGYVNREDADQLTASVGSIVAAVQMLVVNGMLIWKYIASRTQLKQAITLQLMAERHDMKLTQMRLLMAGDGVERAQAMRMMGVALDKPSCPRTDSDDMGCGQKSG